MYVTNNSVHLSSNVLYIKKQIHIVKNNLTGINAFFKSLKYIDYWGKNVDIYFNL